jgi:hypothetical protein
MKVTNPLLYASLLGAGKLSFLLENLRLMVKNVSVNYAIRFNGPVTPPTARRVRFGIDVYLICQFDPRSGIRTRLFPAAFLIALSISFFPLLSYTDSVML